MPKSIQVFPIVGVGASAGGIDSFKKFLGAVPPDSGMAYVLVQHLDPTHESLLPEILSRATQIPVHEITDNLQLRPNNIYILPQNKMLKVTDHSLKLTPRDNKILNLPIDLFFDSLAEVHKTLAVGVVLSGTAQDGTNGLKRIKENGGITFAEDPLTAAWAGMPQSAIDAGVVDFQLSPEEIMEKLLEINKVYKNTLLWEEEKLPKGQEDAFRQILSLLRLKSNVDFNYYKQPTLKRRIARRMAINQTDSLQVYLDLLRENKIELDALFHDMLIQVTSFFRDPKTFKELLENVFPSIIRNRSTDKEPIRIWVAGCATGEEAYSMAIAIHEILETSGDYYELRGRKIQVFATDISSIAIEKARRGIYSTIDVEPIHEDRLHNYFTKINNDYKVKKEIRDLIVFAPHNFLKDPPFAKMDLISCRNVFIYMDPFLQKKALNTFHYALKNNGFLVLGKAETASSSTELFATFSKHEKIYLRKKGVGRYVPIHSTPINDISVQNTKKHSKPLVQSDFRKSAESILISRHTPPNVVVDEQMEVVQINGIIAPFLEQTSGKPTFNLIKMAQEGLGFELRNALHKAKTGQISVIKEDIPIRGIQESLLVTLEVIPLSDTPEPHYLILFHKESAVTPAFQRMKKKWKRLWNQSGKNEMQLQIRALRKELAHVREDMRGISQDQEATNEELQSANEELLSSNEEMQSLNEELETSKEELQCTNEELVIINQELMEKQDQISDQLGYTEAILETLHESLVILDKDLKIQKVNTAFNKKFQLEEHEVVGKSLLVIQDGIWNNKELVDILKNILPQKETMNDYEIEMDLGAENKNHLCLNAREGIDGKRVNKLILLAIEDITDSKLAIDRYHQSIMDLKQTNEQLDQFVNVASHDLQEPLRKILTFSDRLRKKGEHILSNEMTTYLEKIENSSNRMSTLIKGLLNYSRTANHEKEFEKIDLNETIGNLLPDFEVVIDELNVNFNIANLPALRAIPLQMEQLFHNLISNALKFSKNNAEPKIDVFSRELDKQEITTYSTLDHNLKYIEIIVKDNGIGFDQKHDQQIFKIFKRLNRATDYNGTGIGLALVKRIVENHEGEIFALSQKGEGAEFHIILPVEGAY